MPVACKIKLKRKFVNFSRCGQSGKEAHDGELKKNFARLIFGPNEQNSAFAKKFLTSAKFKLV